MRKEATEAEVGSAQIRPRVWGRGVDLPRFWPMIIRAIPQDMKKFKAASGELTASEMELVANQKHSPWPHQGA